MGLQVSGAGRSGKLSQNQQVQRPYSFTEDSSTFKHCLKRLLATCLAFWAHFGWLIFFFFIPVIDYEWLNVHLTSHSDICSSCKWSLVAENNLNCPQEEHVSGQTQEESRAWAKKYVSNLGPYLLFTFSKSFERSNSSDHITLYIIQS